MPKMKTDEIGLAGAAQLLRVTYWAARTLVLTGRLDGRQDPANGRWLVTRRSVERLQRERQGVPA
jgi:hypothetical protein